MIKKFFNQDKISVGVIAVLASEALCALVLWLGLLIAGEPFGSHLRWLAVIFVPALLVMRYYMRLKTYLNTTKAAITTMFVTFVAFMWVLLRYHIISI